MKVSKEFWALESLDKFLCLSCNATQCFQYPQCLGRQEDIGSQ